MSGVRIPSLSFKIFILFRVASIGENPRTGKASSTMSSTAKERAERLFHHRQEGAKTALSDYQAKEQALRELTAKLRAERLAREVKSNLRPVRKPRAK